MINNFLFKRKVSIICLLLIYSCSSNDGSHGINAFIRFDDTKHDFGKIRYKNETKQIFKFTNPGETSLVIISVETSCGCTAAHWTNTPVKPGKSGKIMIKYDAAFPGTFEKTITVHYNGKDSPAILKIKGQVAYPEDMEEPAE